MDKLKKLWENSGIVKKIGIVVVAALILGAIGGILDVINGDSSTTSDNKTEQKEDTTKKEETNKKEETPKQEEKDVKSIFLKHDFKDFNGNMRLDISEGNYILFMFYGDTNVNMVEVVKDGVSAMYLYNANYGGTGTAKYDYKTNSFREGATGTDADKEKIDYAKATFESTLKSLGLTTNDLNNYAKSIK